jgi:hypothetical protein
MTLEEALKRYGEFYEAIEKLGKLPIAQPIKVKDINIDNALYQRIHNAMSMDRKSKDVINYLCLISLKVVIFFIKNFTYVVEDNFGEEGTEKQRALLEFVSFNNGSPLIRNIYRLKIRSALLVGTELEDELNISAGEIVAGMGFGQSFNRYLLIAIQDEIKINSEDQ